MGPVEKATRSVVHEGDQLATPADRRPFWVGKLSSEGIILELGKERTPTFFKWRCLEDIPGFIAQYGRVRINGSGKSQDVVTGTLDGFLKQHVNRLTAPWVAALLEKAGIITIERTRPAFVKLNRSASDHS